MSCEMKQKREISGLTQKQLANKVSVSEQFIYLIEAGERRPSVNTAKKIAKELGFEWSLFYEDAAEAAQN